jgi:hypothetical protein
MYSIKFTQPLRFILLFLIGITTSFSYAQTSSDFLADDLLSDSKISITWDIELTLPAQASNSNPAGYVQIINDQTGEEIYSEIIDSIYNFDSISGTVVTYNKPNEIVEYELRVLEYGPGTVLMDNILAEGKTMVFQPPNITSTPITPWDIRVNLKNNSDYGNKMFLYRSDLLIAILDPSIPSYVEVCDPRIPENIVNGLSYNYTLRSVNTTDRDSVWSDETVSRNTYLVDFNASDDSNNDSIELTWADLSSYVNKLILKRDGITLVELTKEDKKFVDITAIPGYKHTYALELYEDDELKLTLEDLGSLQANGRISGYVFNNLEDGEFTVPGAKVTASATVDGVNIQLDTVTDENGFYNFEEVEYYSQSTYSIEVSIHGDTQSIDVDLDLRNPTTKQDLSIEVSENESESLSHALTDVKATADLAQGNIEIEWTVTGSDTIHYLVYRNDLLIHIGNQKGRTTNTFIDNNGTPLVQYSYTVRTYDRTVNQGVIDYKFSESLNASARVPQPSEISNLVVNSDPRALLKLQWSHPQGNIDGFRIFRSDTLIATIAKNELTYEDWNAVNGNSYVYAVQAFKQVDEDNSYYSSKVFSASTAYPDLEIPSTPTWKSVAGGGVELSWTYTSVSNYNYQGFNILREYNGVTEKLGYVRKELAKEFIDHSGVPGASYNYRIQGHKTNLAYDGQASSPLAVTYPQLPRVTVNSADFEDGFIRFNTAISGGNEYLDIVVLGTDETTEYLQYRGNAEYGQIPWNNYTTGTKDFKLASVKTIDGKKYRSSTKLVSVNITENGPYDLNPVSDLAATAQYAGHVKLSWEYPNYFLPIFKIYRDGILIGSLEGSQKVYYDHSVNDNLDHIYQLEVTLDGKVSKKQGVIGRKLSNTLVYGTAYSEQGKNGVASADVKLSITNAGNTELFATTRTNSAGYYEFKNVPVLGLVSGTDHITVSIAHPNAQFETSESNLLVYDSLQSYTTDFKDILSVEIFPTDTIAWVINLTAIANPQNQSVEIRWQTSNSNYTSFEVYRGLVLIATVQGNSTKLAIDNSGLPGYDYAYRIKPVWQKDRFTEEKGDFFARFARFPTLFGVSDLNGSRLNDLVRINWSHVVDQNIIYKVERNDLLMAMVPSGTPLEFVDSTGSIGEIYKYTVTPLLATNTLIEGPLKSVVVAFPSVKSINELTANQIANGIELEWTRPSIRSTHYQISCNGEVLDTLVTSANGVILDSIYSGILPYRPSGSDFLTSPVNTASVASGYMIEGTLYFGKKKKINFTQNTPLKMVTITATPIVNQDKVIISSGYSELGVLGVEVFRNYISIGRVEYKDLETDYVFEDVTGIPGTNYFYNMQAYSYRDDTMYYSPTYGIEPSGDFVNTEVYATFPKLSAPYAVKAKNIDGIYREVEWKHNREDVLFNIIRFGDCETSSVIEQVGGNLRRTKDVATVLDHELAYGVEAEFTHNGTKYLSDIARSRNTFGMGKELLAWGYNDDGQLGLGHTNSVKIPAQVGTSTDWVRIAGTSVSRFGIKADGTLWSWGDNDYGQLGLGHTDQVDTPAQVGTSTDWVQIAGGSRHAAGIKADGTLWSWGDNDWGELGLGHTNNVHSPTQVGDSSHWATVEAGGDNILAIRTDGTLWKSGNVYDVYWHVESGNPRPAEKTDSIFVQVGSSSNWDQISVGSEFAFGIQTDSTLWSWGYNSYGQLGLGLGSGDTVANPTQVGTGKYFDVSAGFWHTIVRDINQKFSTTGYNYSGQLGTGNTTYTNTFTTPYGGGCSCAAGDNASYITHSYGNSNNGDMSYTGDDWKEDKSLSWKDSDLLGIRSIVYSSSNALALSADLEGNGVSSFTASDGTYGTKVLLEWSLTAGLTGLNILLYRDGDLLSSEPMSATSYFDLTATPGVKHAYTMRIKKSATWLSAPSSDIGHRTPNGVIKGNVITAVGSQPVSGVTIDLKVAAEDGNFYYTTMSDAQGRFRFDNVYYNTLAQVTAVASYPGHEFLQDTLKSELDGTIAVLGIGTFIDNSASLIAGAVTRMASNCPIDSVEVTLIKHYTSKAAVKETKTTDAQGLYSFTVNPFEPDLLSFELELADSSSNNGESVKYDWRKNNVIVNKEDVSVSTPKQDFIDSLGVPYTFSVRNPCSTFDGVKFSFDIVSTDGCYETTIVSNDNGVFKKQYLPPLEYVVSIKGASPLTSDIISVLDYLSVRPIKLDLTSFGIGERADSVLNELFDLESIMMYHNTPHISLVNGAGMSNVTCYPEILLVEGPSTKPAVQANATFKVEETHNGNTCRVNEGYLVIKNTGSDGDDVTLPFDEDLYGFPEYSFTPGVPATIAPYYKTLVAEYHTETSGFISEKIYQLLIEGEFAQPGSDVIIAEEEGKDFQIPLAVLRDPPGDKSYSYLERGVESVKSFSKSETLGGSFTFGGDKVFAVGGVGVKVVASVEKGESNQTKDAITFSQTTTERFETQAESEAQNAQATEYFVGDNADLIIGAGMALKYGIVESIELKDSIAADGTTDCYIIKTSNLGISPDKLKTTWVYTVDHIETIISEYENLLQLAKEGRVTVDGDGKDTGFYRTLIANWTSVLDYHRYRSVPHVNFCNKVALANNFLNKRSSYSKPSWWINDFWDNVSGSEIKDAAVSYQQKCFCEKAGTYDSNDDFHLNLDADSNFVWTDELLDRYRIARSKVEELADYLSRLDEGIQAAAGYTLPSVSLYNDNDFQSLKNNLTSEQKSFAENVTFGGQASIEKSISTSVTNATTYTQETFIDGSLYVGLYTALDLKVGGFVGLGGGVTTEGPKAVETEVNVGATIKVNFNVDYESETSTTTTNTSGYVLADDDAGDQFSVTTIKGIDKMHTAYFQTFAGRSSCPYEPGTIPRDIPDISLEYSDGSPFGSNVLRDLKPDENGYFALKLSNKASEIFNEPRYYSLAQATATNQNGARITFDGENAFPLTYDIPSGGYVYTSLFVGKGGPSYDYSDLEMQLIPNCFDALADIPDGYNGAYIELEAYFRRPCSSVSILSPDDNWRIIRTRDEHGPLEKIIIRLGDYDPENEYMESISIEYRRIGASAWTDIPGSTLTKDSLQKYYLLNKTTYKDPVYPYVWDVLGQAEIIDGKYEIRAYVNCGEEGKVNSNVIRGVIDRSVLSLFGTPKPTDGVLNIGENVEVVFNELVECGYETRLAHYSFKRKKDGTPLDFSPVCNGNSIIYNYNGNLADLDKEVIQMEVFEVQDLNGNKMTDTIKYEFVVSNSPVAWLPYELTVEVYQGESKQIDLSLINSGAAMANLTFSKTGTPDNLLQILIAEDSVRENGTLSYPMLVVSKDQAIGSYDYVVSAAVSTKLSTWGTIEIPIHVNVVATPPNWVVPTGMSQSTVVICNFQMDGEQSIDTMDIIAITIDGEVRGFDNIYKSKAGNDLYYAVVNVQGDAVDQGKTFDYRIWDASQGAEFDGDMTAGAVTFNGSIYGSTLSPRIIDVETEWDSVRYIPLIQGWNWLAFNYQKESMTVDNMLEGLQLTGGEIIKTLSQEAIYSATTNSWFNTSTGLSTINTANGYLLYLNQEDVLRISGKPATKGGVSIINGWSLIGNPNQQNVDINDAFAANDDLEEGAVLKTGGLVNKASVLEGGSWTGGIIDYEVNQSYMIKNSEATVLMYKRDEVAPDNFEYNMTILGSVLFDGNVLQGEGDYIVAEIDGKIRGKGVIEEVNTPARTFMLNMFIYGDSADINKPISFKIYRQNSDEYYTAYTNDSLIFTANLHRGGPDNPYWFANKQSLLSLESIPSPKSFSVFTYPNPFRSQVSVDVMTEENGTVKFSLYDAFGKEVYSRSDRGVVGENSFNLDTPILPSGMYILHIEYNNHVVVKKLLRQ